MAATLQFQAHNERVLMAFTSEQVARLAGISQDRLRYWEKTRTFQPTYIEKRETGPYRRIYAFQDLVNLRAIARLRLMFDVPLHELRNVTAYLRNHRDASWAQLAVRVYGRHLVFRDPDTGHWMVANPTGQLTFELEFSEVREESERDARKLMRRATDHHGKISRHRNVMSNQWVIAGTRIPVEAVVSFAQEGYTMEQILAEYPTLVADDITAALEFEELHQVVA